MKPGQKPIDFATAAARGRRRPERHGKPDDQPATIAPSAKGFPPMPRRVFGDVGKKEWRRIKKALENAGHITQADRAQLIQYCLLYQRMIEDPSGFKASDHNALRLLCESLGLSPPGRGRLRGSGD